MPQPTTSWKSRHPVLFKNLILLAIVAIAEVLLLSNNARLDTAAWRATRWFMGDQQPYSWADVKLNAKTHPDAPWWRTTPPPLHSSVYHHSENFWRILRDIGEPEEVLFICLLLIVYDPAGFKSAGMLLGSVLGAGAVSELFKCVFGRLRPIGPMANGHLNAGHNIWVLFRGFHTQHDLSFPSGHACAAFAMAAAVTYLSPKGRWLWLTLAWLTAFSRVVMQAHFYSDIIMGATIGWFAGFAVTMWLGKRLGVEQRHWPTATAA